MPHPQQCQIRAASATYFTSWGNARSLAHWERPGIKPTSSWISVGFLTSWATTGTPPDPVCRPPRAWVSVRFRKCRCFSKLSRLFFFRLLPSQCVVLTPLSSPLARIPPKGHDHDNRSLLRGAVCVAWRQNPGLLSWQPLEAGLVAPVHPAGLSSSCVWKQAQQCGQASPADGGVEVEAERRARSSPNPFRLDLNLSNTSCFMLSSGHKPVWILTRCPKEMKTIALSNNLRRPGE